MDKETQIEAYLEVGKKKVFAGALEWPGWSRAGKTEAAALQTLLDYGTRYARVLGGTDLGFQPPGEGSRFTIVERLEGNSTTDFGAPAMPPAGDARPVEAADLRRFSTLLEACWKALDEATAAAEGHTLRKGPRGGGRALEKIIRHVVEAERAYLGRLGWQTPPMEEASLEGEPEWIRAEVLAGLASSAAGELPARGPRGGVRWTPRYFVRRVAWHVLDHAWEIEDRID